MPVRMTAIQMSTNNKCWKGCVKKGILLHCWWECKLVQPLWRTVWRFLKKLEIELPSVQFSSVQFIPSVVSDSLRPHGLQPSRLLCPWDLPGKSTGVGCHCLLHQLEWLLSKSLQAINAGEGVEKREPSYTAGGNANCYSHYGEQCGDSLKNWK